MLLQQAYRYDLYPINVQQTLLIKHVGTVRFAYNWGLAERLTRYQNNVEKARYTNAITQHHVLNHLKKIEFSWKYEASKYATSDLM